MKVRRALVTGGAGFIGSHIVDALIERGVEVCVADDLTTGSPANLSAHDRDPRLRLLRADVRYINETKGIPEEIDVAFHEAAIASVPKSVDDPMLVHDVNVRAALEVMNFCLRHRIRRFIFASSAAVYGPVLDPPAVETDRCSPSSPYGASKLSVENYMQAYGSTYGLETVALRYFNVYGPRQKMNDDYSGVIPLFSRQLLKSITPTVYGDGLQTRDFVHVRDVAAANLLAMESESAPAQVFNIASGREVSILRLLETLSDIVGSGPVIPRFAEPRRGDLRVGTSSIQKAKSILGFEPRVSLEQGLQELIGHIGCGLGVGAVAG